VVCNRLQSIDRTWCDRCAGLYEIAVLSDDGSILYLDNGLGAGLQPAIENDGEHSNRIVCSSVAYNFSNSVTNPTIMPMELKYFQGPKESIAAQIFWRKVASSSSSSLYDMECATPSTSSDPLSGLDDNYYYDTANDSKEQTPIETSSVAVGMFWHRITSCYLVALSTSVRHRLQV